MRLSDKCHMTATDNEYRVNELLLGFKNDEFGVKPYFKAYSHEIISRMGPVH